VAGGGGAGRSLSLRKALPSASPPVQRRSPVANRPTHHRHTTGSHSRLRNARVGLALRACEQRRCLRDESGRPLSIASMENGRAARKVRLGKRVAHVLAPPPRVAGEGGLSGAYSTGPPHAEPSVGGGEMRATPVEPNPPAARSVSSKSSTATTSGVEMRSRMS